MPQIKDIPSIIAAHRACREKVIAAQDAIFDLHMNEELECIHSVVIALDEKIELLQMLLDRQNSPDSKKQ